MPILNKESLPLHHIAIIMDGNGRWAKKRGLPRAQGHVAGVVTTEKIIEYAHKIGLETLTLYAFSTENWKRPKAEIDALMKLLSVYLDKIIKRLLKKNDRVYNCSKVNFMGDLSVLNEELKEKIKKCHDLCLLRSEIKTTINIAVNYGGKDEILHAVNRFIAKNPGKSITEEDMNNNLYFAGQKEPDLIIRTAGEMRLSNFLIWESAYSEFYSAEEYWPDFNSKSLDKAIEAFKSRSRRYGGL